LDKEDQYILLLMGLGPLYLVLFFLLPFVTALAWKTSARPLAIYMWSLTLLAISLGTGYSAYLQPDLPFPYPRDPTKAIVWACVTLILAAACFMLGIRAWRKKGGDARH
jgi:uncharacterized membrane protein